MNRTLLYEEDGAQFEDACRNRAHLVALMPGFSGNQVLRQAAPGDPYIVLTQ